MPVVAHATMPRPRLVDGEPRAAGARRRRGATGCSDTARENQRPLRVRAYAMQLLLPLFVVADDRGVEAAAAVLRERGATSVFAATS